MFVESKGFRRFHLQQPIDLLECGGVALVENVVDDGSNTSGVFKGPRDTHEEDELTSLGGKGLREQMKQSVPPSCCSPAQPKCRTPPQKARGSDQPTSRSPL